MTRDPNAKICLRCHKHPADEYSVIGWCGSCIERTQVNRQKRRDYFQSKRSRYRRGEF